MLSNQQKKEDTNSWRPFYLSQKFSYVAVKNSKDFTETTLIRLLSLRIWYISVLIQDSAWQLHL